MTITLSLEELRRARLRSQLLAPGSQLTGTAETVRHLVALQSQEWSSAQLALAARTRGITQDDLRRAREVERSFVLTWSLRGTLHLVSAEDLRWQLALCGPGAIRGTRRRYQQLGLTEEARERGLEAIQAILSRDGALIRSELAQALAERGIPVAGQAIHHLLRFAALRGLICFGPERGGALTYTLLDDWLPDYQAPAATDKALSHFARRFLRAYGPAASADFARWSGLSKAQVKAAWKAVAGECLTVSSPDGEALMLKEQWDALKTAPAESIVRLLPRYDNYSLAYASRAFMVADKYAKRVHPGGGLIRACVLIDGEAKASWKLEKRRRGLRVVVSPFMPLERSILPRLEAEVAALGDFLKAAAELQLTTCLT